MNDKIKEVSELLKKDLNDEIVVMQLMTYPKPELVIAGLIKIIKEDRARFDKQVTSISQKMNKLEERTKGFDSAIDSMNRILDFIKNNGVEDKDKQEPSKK